MNRPAQAPAAFALLLLALTAHAAPPEPTPAAAPALPAAPAPPAPPAPAAEPTVSVDPPADPGVSADPTDAADPAADANASVDDTAPPPAPANESTDAASAAAALAPAEAAPADDAPLRGPRRARTVAMTGIRIFGADGRCLDAHAGQQTTGTPVVLAACHGRADQRWSVTPGGRIRGAGGHCLDVTGRSPDDLLLPGADVIMTRCDGREDDQTFARTTGGELRVHGDNCLSLDRPANAPIVRLEVRPCDGGADQRWYFGAPPAPAVLRISEGDGHCPAGYAPLPVDEATASLATVCPLLAQWSVARLAGGGSIDGPGYGCAIRADDPRPLGHTLCRPARKPR